MTSAGPVGEFALVGVDGQNLPATVRHGDRAVEVRSGSLSFGTDGTCRSETRFSVASGREIHRVVQANVRAEGGDVVLRWQGAGLTRGRLTGDQFAMTNENSVFVYRR
jgi:hypothetical protein